VFGNLVQFIRVKTRTKAVLVGIAAAALALGLGLAPAAGFFGHGKSSSGVQVSARLGGEAPGLGAPASQGSHAT
jgi:hypothetical protein